MAETRAAFVFTRSRGEEYTCAQRSRRKEEEGGEAATLILPPRLRVNRNLCVLCANPCLRRCADRRQTAFFRCQNFQPPPLLGTPARNRRTASQMTSATHSACQPKIGRAHV